MKIEAHVSNTGAGHVVEVATNGQRQNINISRKTVGQGSSVNGGELLFAALATCFCNDLYREAAKRNIEIAGVEVDVTGVFENPGEAAKEISYRVRVDSGAPASAIKELISLTDSVAEIQMTVRQGCAVRLEGA